MLTIHSCWPKYWPGPFNYFQFFQIQGFMVFRKGTTSRISRIAQMNMNLLVIWSILSRKLSNEDMELKLEIQGNFLLQSAAREGRISFRDLIGAIRIRVPYCTMAELTKCCPKNIIPFLLQDWFNMQMRAKQIYHSAEWYQTAKMIFVQPKGIQ